jgi:hypothetical protein
VPKFYLDGFADGDEKNKKIGVVRLADGTRYPQSTAKVSVINDFYNIDGAAPRDVIEKLIGEIEAGAAPVFRKVRVDGVWPLGSNDRSILATFFGLQNLRGPKRRRAFGEIAEAIANALGQDGLADTSVDVQANVLKHAHIASMLDVRAYAPYYFGRSWALVRFNRKHLLTCDTPVSLLPNPATPDALVGIGTAWAILFPMSRTAGLVMYENLADHPQEVASGQTDSTPQGSTYLAELFNDATIYNARECIFHHLGDASLIPAELPEPRAVELSTDHPDPEPDDEENAK